MSVITRRYSTGVPFLDRRIGGGLVPGGLLALTSPPTSQGELLLAELLSARQTVFLSTARSETAVEEWAAAKASADELTVRTVDPAAVVDDPGLATDLVAPESFLIVDTADPLETVEREAYLEFLRELKARLRETDSVGVLHCRDEGTSPPRRGLTLQQADYVWQVELLVLSREIKTRLLVTKARRGRALTEPIPLRLTDRVQIDTSRRIA